MVNKRLINTGVEAAAFDPLQNFETVTYAGNSGTQKITGYIRKGAAFNGSSSGINTGSNFNLANNSFSFSFWIFNEQTTTTWGTVIGNNQSSIGNNIALLIGRNGTTGKMLFDFYNNGLSSTTNVSTDGSWQHWVCTYDASTNSRKIYLNGNLDASDTASADFQGTTDILIGRIGTWSNAWWLGKIDQVRIFDTALNLTQAGQLADEEYGDAKNSTTDFFGDGSGVALYQLDEDADDTGVPIDSGQSAVFNGGTSKVALSGSTSLTNRTISIWFNPSKSTNLTLLDNTQGKVNGAKQFGRWNMLFNYGGLNYAVWNEYNGSQYGMATFSYTFNVNTWYHIVFSVESNNNAVYVNGVSQSLTVTRGDSIGTVNLADCTLGFDRDISSLCFDGKIDQVRIYSSALSSGDITNLYNESSVPTANLVAHYKLDGDATDETTNYNGTWGGAEAYSDPAVRNYNGTPTNVNFLGMAFQPDFIWIKGRTIASNHALFDVVRGNTKRLESDNSNAESTYSYFSSFDANGFTVGNQAAVNSSSTDYVAWCWKAGGAAVSNTDGDITSQVSANQDAGFSIVKYSGDNNSSSRVGHGLSQTPEMIILKNLSTSYNWTVSHIGLNNDRILFLEDSVDEQSTGKTSGTIEAQENHTSETFGFVAGSGTYPLGGVNYTGYDCIAYCFHSVDGYQKIGSYTGTGQPNNDVTTGFRPRWVMIKSTAAQGWNIVDSVRNPSNPANLNIQANTSDAESSTANPAVQVDFDDTGFSLVAPAGTPGEGQVNSNGTTYIYLAIA